MKKKNGKIKWIIGAAVIVVCLAGGIVAANTLFRDEPDIKQPRELLTEYMNHIINQEYAQMYQMIDVVNSANISEEDFITRNTNIYKGIELQELVVDIPEDETEEDTGAESRVVSYHTRLETLAGPIEFDNQAEFLEGEQGYQLVWHDGLIFPELTAGDKVSVTTSEAVRGEILDRNGQLLAGAGTASSVGVVPGKLTDREKSLEQIGELLEMEPEAIENQLAAAWVQDDSFVPLKTIPKIEEIDLLAAEPDEELPAEQARQEELLEIPGVMISDVAVREYPLAEAAAHLVGYVQSVTAEDLEEHADEDYNANSVIGRSGMEGLYEKELKGENGHQIVIQDQDGAVKSTLASIPKQDGQDIQLTIDSNAQQLLYQQFQEDKSTSVAMNPYTGEILALISTPAYDNNDFIMGMSDQQWTLLNEDENQPMYNRFRQTWSPGSVLKPLIAAIGLESGAIDPNEDYGSEGLSWQKDSSWGSYQVTTLHTYEPVILENALIYSDNIYFAKAALNIGAERLASAFDQLGLKQELPFEISVTNSQYSNSDQIESEVLLADSGYGQGQILINPIHLTSLYSLFSNGGNVIKPYLLYEEGKEPEIWLPQAFTEETTEEILNGMKKVVSDPNGTGYAVRRDDIELAGKTGTAEIKLSQDDTEGTELGWFSVFTTDPETENPILLVSMVEDVKDAGGSGYVVNKAKNVLDAYLGQNQGRESDESIID